MHANKKERLGDAGDPGSILRRQRRPLYFWMQYTFSAVSNLVMNNNNDYYYVSYKSSKYF
jgi:hypothetical protein